MLAESGALIGSRQIRNLATIGGNICNAVPSADTAPPLLAADAEVLVEGPNGQRRLQITDFFTGPRETRLEADELVLEFVLPGRPQRTGCVYRRHTPRRALDLAMAGVAASITLEPGSEVIQGARIALGAVAPVPLRAGDAEKMLEGNELSEELLDEAAELAVRTSSPISDVRGSAEYRKEIIRVLTHRCVRGAVERAVREA
jgi:carbon-monoxide dehydrogenase medium subunit